MIFSIALVLLVGYLMGEIFKALKLPPLVGMIIAGIVLGPQVINALSSDFIELSVYLRKIALVVIILRAGLTIDLKDLKEIGRPAILMSFVPALFEIAAVTIVAPLITDISYLEAAMLGCILAPVSAAVVIPSMIKIIKTGYGNDKKVGQIILAGTSNDDMLAIVLFTVLIGVFQGENVSFMTIASVPLSLIVGILLGIIVGVILSAIFKMFEISVVAKVLILLSVSLLIVAFEDNVPSIPQSSLLSIITVGMIILKNIKNDAILIEGSLNKMWFFLQIFLFISIGALIDLKYASDFFVTALLIIISGTAFRFVAVWLSLSKTNLTFKERLFCGISYLPKATVQAAMSSIPLSLGVPAGELILTVSVMAIIILAPIGSALIELTYKKILSKEQIERL
ncbi:MAG: cation:proton antiporter [Acholeplasma sp.]|nr:cation:proton antiporter [Acholeplasma sp.]